METLLRVPFPTPTPIIVGEHLWLRLSCGEEQPRHNRSVIPGLVCNICMNGGIVSE